MGKTLAIAAPFLIATILFLFFSFYKAGKRKGLAEAPQRDEQIGNVLLRRVDDVLGKLVMRSDVSLEDILSTESRKEINQWRSDYAKAKKRELP